MIGSTASMISRLPDATDLSKTHVVVLNNFIGPHHCKVLRACQERVGRLSVLLSTPMESNRDWRTQWDGLDVRIQKTWTLKRQWKHRQGFADDNFIHFPWDTQRQLKSLRPDVILSYEMGARTWLGSRYCKKVPDCILVMVANMSQHTESSRGLVRPRFRRYLVKRIDLATYNGPSCRAYLASLGFTDEQLLHYPYCHDAGVVYRGSRDQVPDRPRRLFYCGSLTERKGILPFCESLRRWAEHNPQRQATLTLAGRGPLRPALESLDLPPNLTLEFLGSVAPERLAEQYGRADISVFPTLADEWGLVVTESMASGLPVLGSRYAQAVTTLCDETNSWTFVPDNRSSLDSALTAAMNSTAQQRRMMSRNARETVAYLNTEYAADNFEKIVEKALALKNSRVPGTANA